MQTQKQTWTESDEIRDVANKVINRHHSHLATAKIRYFFFSKEIMTGDQQTWGRARKISGINAVLANSNGSDEQFFAIEIWRFIWDAITPAQREALVDHELEHCFVDDSGRYSLIKHDLEEFTNIVRRHGLWRTAIQIFVDAATGKGQANLFDEQTRAEAPETATEPVEEDAQQNFITGRPQLQLVGSPDSAPRQLGAGETRHIVCPHCANSTSVAAALADEWYVNPEMSIICDHCRRSFTRADADEAFIDAEIIEPEEVAAQETSVVRCPLCDAMTPQLASDINAWANDEIDLQCTNCAGKFDSSHLNAADKAA